MHGHGAIPSNVGRHPRCSASSLFELSEANQTHVDYLEAQACRIEQGEQIVGEELDTLKGGLEQATTQ